MKKSNVGVLLRRSWEDPSFPATDASINTANRDRNSFRWMRPAELCDNPQMFADGHRRYDVIQGQLGNCWFLAALVSVCATREHCLLHRLIPEDNRFVVAEYCGVFHFRFWQYGRWVDVVIDDRLPTRKGKLVFLHSPTHNEFWPALLEKAYAKLHGSYEALSGGCASEAMEDFTGGIAESYNLNKELPKDLFKITTRALKMKSLMSCSIDVADGQNVEGVLANGLILGHAYTIVTAKEVDVKGRKIQLLCIRNPWGNQYEWKGAWSDRSPEWRMLSEDQRRELGQVDKDDGEFWMSFEDFVKNFSEMELCMMTPVCKDAHEGKCETCCWNISVHEGSWTRNVNAGGCRNYLDTFWTNPQYYVDVMNTDAHDGVDEGTLIIALMQKERRKKRVEGLDLLTIGYCVYKVPPDTNAPMDKNFFLTSKTVGKLTFSNVRGNVGRHKLAPGRYVIVPSTFKPNEQGDFLLRIFSESHAPAAEMDEETGLTKPGTRKNDADTRPMKSDENMDEEKLLRKIFGRIAGDDLAVDPFELKDILDRKFKSEFKFDGFCLEAARSMVAMMDIDHSGKLDYEEFINLWADLRQWKKVFLEYDKDNSLTLDSFELRAALNSAGFRISNSTFKCLAMRYSDKKGHVYFNDFILCAVRLKTMFGSFETASSKKNSKAQFTIDEFIQTTMYS